MRGAVGGRSGTDPCVREEAAHRERWGAGVREMLLSCGIEQQPPRMLMAGQGWAPGGICPELGVIWHAG